MQQHANEHIISKYTWIDPTNPLMSHFTYDETTRQASVIQ